MTLLDVACTAAVAVGIVCASIGALAWVSTTDLRIRLEGALCALMGVACIVVGNLDALGTTTVVSG